MRMTDVERAALAALPEYESKATPAERDSSLCTVRDQLYEFRRDGTVTCPDCGRSPIIREAYRCVYCGVWFCRTCAQIHFGMRVPKVYEDRHTGHG